MSSIAIITDTDCSLPFDLSDKYNICQVPINIHFGEEAFRTEIDINDVQLFQRIDKEGQLPTTSAPSPGQFSEAYQEAFDAGAEEVVCITVSSEVSATYAAALNAKDLHPDKKISVVDSRSLSLGQGFIALRAAELAQAGKSSEEIITGAMSLDPRSHFYAALATLRYLAMSGRVGHLAAGMATVLNIKPILSIQDGKLDMLEKVRTRKKAWARVIQLTADTIGDGAVEMMGVVHVSAREHANEFASMLRAEVNCPDDILIADLTAGLSVHSGAGMVGVGFVMKE